MAEPKRKKIVSEEVREKSQKLKRLITIIIFIVMLAVIACYATGLDNYLHPKPKFSPEVSAWGDSENEEESDAIDDGSFNFDEAKEQEGEPLQNSDDSVTVTDPYKDTVTTEEIPVEPIEDEDAAGEVSEKNTEEVSEETTE